MNVNNNPINIFDFDGTLTTETWPKFWVWVKKFGYDGTKRNACLEEALTEYRKKNSGSMLETFFTFFIYLLIIMKLLHLKSLWKEKNLLSIIQV